MFQRRLHIPHTYTFGGWGLSSLCQIVGQINQFLLALRQRRPKFNCLQCHLLHIGAYGSKCQLEQSLHVVLQFIIIHVGNSDNALICRLTDQWVLTLRRLAYGCEDHVPFRGSFHILSCKVQ